MSDGKFIASLDVGTTTIRCFIFNSNMQVQGMSTDQVKLIYPHLGHVEIEPEILWETILRTIKSAISNANLKSESISSLGITTQRCTFITWDKCTGNVFHNFITWKDLRADNLVKKWNSSLYIKSLRTGCSVLHSVTRNARFLAGSVLKLMNTQITMRLLWVMQNNNEFQKAINNKTALFGTLESWLLYRFRQGNDRTKQVEHISDISNATATGFFDPFTLKWAGWALNMFSIKEEILPKVVDNSYDYGTIDPSIFGAPIRIGCSISDQSASLFGSNCFNKGDIKVTLGTGSFLNVNTGDKCNASVHGLYPLVAWRLHNNENPKIAELIYCVEGASNDTGSIIQWAINFGLFKDPSLSSDIANSVENSDGAYFVPAFSGIGAPINDNLAASGILGLKPSTTNAHMVRAVLESIAYRVTQLYQCTLHETNFKFNSIRVDGGVSKNDFICQLLADLTGLNVERPKNTEVSVLGAGFLAGLNTGIFKTKNDLTNFIEIEKVFKPREEKHEILMNGMQSWERAIERFRCWYNPKELKMLSKSTPCLLNTKDTTL